MSGEYEYDGTEDEEDAAMARAPGRPTFYRVRLGGEALTGRGEGVARFLGTELVGDIDRMATVLEPDALCFDRPSEAADAAVRFGEVPFTVEVAR